MKHFLGNSLRAVRNQLVSWLTVDWGDRHQTVILAGAGRSGTTWVQGLINARNDYRILFEPFYPDKVSLVQTWNRRQYLTRDESHPEFLAPAEQILAGDIRQAWVDKYNRKTPAQKRLIKEIRGQLFLKWIQHNFPEIPIILLLRHPCAVANSRLKLGWGSLMGEFLQQDALMEDFLTPFKATMENTEDAFEQHVLGWCIENYVPLCQFSEGEICVAFYEHLCLDPQTGMKRIWQFLGEEEVKEISGLSAKPSAVSQKDSAIVSGHRPSGSPLLSGNQPSGSHLIEAWRKQVSDTQVKKTLEICQLFGLDALYGPESLPRVDESEVLKLFS